MRTDEDPIALARRLAVHDADAIIAGVPSCQGRKTATGEPAPGLATMDSADFWTDARRLASLAGWCGGLSLGSLLAHRRRPPNLAD